MSKVIRQVLHLFGLEQRKRWVVLVLLGVLVGVMETLGTVLIFGLLAILTTGAAPSVDLPLIGDIRARFGTIDDRTFILWAAAIVAAFFVLRAFVFLAQSYAQNRMAQNAGARLSARLLAGYFEMPYVMYLRRNSAELIRNAHYSVTQIVTFAFVPLALLASEAIIVVGIIVALLLTAPAATAMSMLIVTPVVIGLLRGMQRGMKTFGETSQSTNRSVLQVLQESFQNLRDIRILGRERFFIGEFLKHRARLARALYLRGVVVEIPRVTTETMLVLFILVFLVVVTATGSDLERSLALLGTFGYAGIRVLPALNRIVASVNNLRFAAPAVDTLEEELAEFAPAVSRVDSSAHAIDFRHDLVAENVSFRFDEPGPVILDDVTLTIPRASWVGIIGTTGAGKSTLVDLLMGLLVPTDGSIKVDGVSIEGNQRAWQEKLGVVPQTIFLLDDSLRRNIALGVPDHEIDEARIHTVLRQVDLEDFVASLDRGLNSVVGERGVKLSGGQRQRVAIARALYRDPEVLILDEATAALDNVTEARIIDSLDAFRRERTLIFVAHRLTTVTRCDHIFVMERGRIVDRGTFDELRLRNPMFRDTPA